MILAQTTNSISALNLSWGDVMLLGTVIAGAFSFMQAVVSIGDRLWGRRGDPGGSRQCRSDGNQPPHQSTACSLQHGELRAIMDSLLQAARDTSAGVDKLRVCIHESHVSIEQTMRAHGSRINETMERVEDLSRRIKQQNHQESTRE